MEKGRQHGVYIPSVDPKAEYMTSLSLSHGVDDNSTSTRVDEYLGDGSMISQAIKRVHMARSRGYETALTALLNSLRHTVGAV